MAPYQFYFNTGTKPKAAWSRKEAPLHIKAWHIRLGLSGNLMYLRKPEINFPSLVFE